MKGNLNECSFHVRSQKKPRTKIFGCWIAVVTIICQVTKISSSLDSSVTSEIKLGDADQVKSLGKGVVSMLTKQDEKKDIYDVYYVPSLKHNLMSAR